MSPADCAVLLALVSPYITYKDARWRKAISPVERLAVTIRLAVCVHMASCVMLSSGSEQCV